MAETYYFYQVTDHYGAVIQSEDRYLGADEDGLKAVEEAFAFTSKRATLGSRIVIIAYDAKNRVANIIKSRTIDTIPIRELSFESATNRAFANWRKEDKVAAALLSARNNLGDFVNMDRSGLSYLPSERINVDVFRNPWQTWSFRVSGRPGRIAKQIIEASGLGADLTANDYEQFTNRWKATYAMDTSMIQVVRGEEIAWAYDQANSSPSSNGSSLFSSCMRYSICRPYLRIYTENPDKIGLAVVKDANGLIRARAMVWNLDNGQIFVDRVFGPSDMVNLFADWAKEKGYVHRAYNGAGHHLELMYDGKKVSDGTMFCTVSKADFPDYPHIDTFTYVDHKTGRLTNNSDYRHTRCATGTQGRWSNPQKMFFPLEADGGWPEEADCAACYDKFKMTKDDRDLYREKRFWCRKCYKRHFKACEHCGDVHYASNMYVTHITKKHYCMRCGENRLHRCRYCTVAHEQKSSLITYRGSGYCIACVSGTTNYCMKCDSRTYVETLYKNGGLCSRCQKKKEDAEQAKKEAKLDSQVVVEDGQVLSVTIT